MGKLAYKAFSLILGLLGGVLAGAVFQRIWKIAGREETAPQPTDEERGWREVLTVAAVRGAVTAAVKAAVTRSGAAGMRRVTGTWPA
ncbi:DUF4235 domain-containing protein [Streptomyces sp. bgisy100]|uniref:DUF4235 domain-containing protein n=1 Tax=Streptomyces sp. bgisy100 TaxID=3413783 RepID=UPI003D749623